MMEVLTCDTHIAADSATLEELLDERLAMRGTDPQAPAMDAEGNALLVWLETDEQGTIFARSLALARDEDRDGSTPGPVEFVDELAYPVLVFMARQGTGIPEGTGVTFGG